MANQKKKQHTDKRTLWVRVMAIVLAVMMIGSIAAGLFLH
jgi:hypothetical protein